jgi:hypothetical protein
MISPDAIVELAVCACGHGIARHDDHGCPGARATFCMCMLTPGAALDAAIERVRRESCARNAVFSVRANGGAAAPAPR